MAKKKPKIADNIIVQNKKARHDYFIETTFEAGISLMGWEVKALREKKVQLTDSYVFLKNGEAWLLNTLITPLPTASTHFVTEPTRYRKLLLNKKELSKIIDSVNQKGHTCVCTKLYWKGHLVKVEIALAKGKQEHDKRQSEKERDWNREKQRVLSNKV
ncbi:MAG: SsrA-binding protein SmpB [Pseudomonadales bacterium]|nr:SsrA-binding protein SmpB [Pseudomonadales bacterium]